MSRQGCLGTHQKSTVFEIRIKRKHKEISVHPREFAAGFSHPSEPKRGYLLPFTGTPNLVVECDGIGFLCLIVAPNIPVPSGDHVLDTTDGGVIPETTTVQTKLLQGAIDRVAETDGLTTLVLPAGHYRAGDLHLRTGVELHLASGAVVHASDSAADIGDATIGGWDQRRACFINSDGADNISIIGHGHIDGNRPALDMDRYFKGMVLLRGRQQRAGARSSSQRFVWLVFDATALLGCPRIACDYSE